MPDNAEAKFCSFRSIEKGNKKGKKNSCNFLILYPYEASSSIYRKNHACKTFPSSTIPGLEKRDRKSIQIDAASADSLFHIPDKSVDTIVTDPPYYSTIQYAELSDFFYVWQERTLRDIFPDLFWSELTDKDREAVANPSRFRNMGASPKELA